MTGQYQAVGMGTTNTATGSIVVVTVSDLIVTWEVQVNAFNDQLPIIPSDSRVQSGKVLYRLKIKATLASRSKNSPKAGHGLTVTSNRRADSVNSSSATTDTNGIVFVTLETREKGALKLKVSEADVAGAPLELTLKDAWYESKFLITGYNVCNESDFGGALVAAHGLANRHREDFLFGARGIVMQGTGMALDGQYIRPTRVGSNWATNSRGNPTRLANPSGVTFTYTNSVQGAFGAVTDNHSMAVDPTVIPPHAQVEIESVGARYADDRGSRIIGYHIDNFLGAGNAVVQAWQATGFNSTQRKVKFKG